MPAALGIFLPETHRLAPAVCNFTSEAFYDGRLTSRSGREKQVLSGVAGIEGAGLWVKKVAHEGNKNSSAEEAQAVALLAKTLVAKGSLWTDAEGTTHPMLDQDLCIVAAYNAQVAHIKSALREHLPNAEIAVGTVDKFQGQEAPVVIYSMASSSAEDAARGMEFLYSLNRLNVAHHARSAPAFWLPARASLRLSAGVQGRCNWRMRFVCTWRWRGRCSDGSKDGLSRV